MIEYAKNETDIYIDKYEEPNNHISALLEASIITLDIRPRLLYPLWNAGIRTVEQLSRRYRSGLRSIPQIGVCAEYEIGLILSNSDLLNVHDCSLCSRRSYREHVNA